MEDTEDSSRLSKGATLLELNNKKNDMHTSHLIKFFVVNCKHLDRHYVDTVEIPGNPM